MSPYLIWNYQNVSEQKMLPKKKNCLNSLKLIVNPKQKTPPKIQKINNNGKLITNHKK